MRAFVYEHGTLHMKEMNGPQAGAGEVVINLRVAGLNRRDLYIPDRRGSNKPALILGSDGAGVVEDVGTGVTNVSVGDEVIVNPSLRWFENSFAPPKTFEILGMPDHGTFAERIVISKEQVEKKPSYLSWEEAGVLALSSLTGYRALFTKGRLKKDETVFIPGAGSGVATYLINFAKALGARVIVTSRSEEKRNKALQLGAHVVLDTESDWKEQLKHETIDIVIESVGQATFNKSLNVLKQGGRMVVFGATAGDIVSLDLREFFYGQYTLLGSTMGSREEFRHMLSFMTKHQIRPVIDQTFPLSKAHQAFARLERNEQFGKLALNIHE